jgi:hypothetical protein
MRIYKIRMYDADRGAILGWAGSERGALATLAAYQKARGEEAQGPEGVERVEIRTDKAGLIAWLNTHFDSDNG